MINGEILQVTSERTGTTVLISVSGELDLSSTPKLSEQTDLYLADHAEIIVVDLSGVTFIDSAGIRALIEAAQLGNNRVRIIPNDVCLRLFDLVGLTHRLPLVIDGTDGTENRSTQAGRQARAEDT